MLLDRRYDVGRLQADVQTIVSTLAQPHYVYYSAIPLAMNIADAAAADWAGQPMLDGCPYLQEIFGQFDCGITSIRLMRLEAGADIQQHCDPTLDSVFREVVRLTLPVFSSDDVTFLLDGSPVPMQPGELWYLRLSELHSVHHRGSTERINMSIDLTWNDWVEDWLRTIAEDAPSGPGTGK